MMLPKFIARSLYWSMQNLRGRSDLAQYVDLLESTQWLTRAELQEFSFLKLRRLVIHAYETVPYYREVMGRAGFSPYKMQHADDLKVLPMLSRGDLEKNFERLKSSKIRDMGAHLSVSSGSTGQPARFIQDRQHDLWARAHQIRTYGWCGNWKVGDPFALVWGSPVYWEGQDYVRRAEALFSNRIELNCNSLGAANLGSMLHRLVEFRPTLISGYSTALYLLAQRAAVEGVKIEGLRAVQPNAEPTYDYMTRAMKLQFGVPVFDKYGSTETNIIAHQSPGNESALLQQVENTHVEFMRDNTTYCQPGEEGFLVVTTLNNYSMPLIRYRTSDIAAPMAGQCPTGRGMPLMSKVLGRAYDHLVTTNGDRVHPQVFSNLFSNFANVVWFQVIQNELHSLHIKIIVRDRSKTEGLEQACTKMINLRTNGHFKVTFEYLDAVPQSPNGKYKSCICNIVS